MLNIALNTFREIIRNKFFYLIIFFSIVFILFSIVNGKLSIGDDAKIITDFGLTMIEIFGLISVIFVGSQLLFKEIEGKTIYLILTKPVKKHNFLIGKFLGFMFCIFVIVLIESVIFLLVLYFKNIEIETLVVTSLFFTFLKLIILLGIVFFFSTFMSNILTILTSVMIYFVSQDFSLIIDLVKKANNSLISGFVDFLNILFPPFEALNTKDMIGTFSEISTKYILTNTYYSLFYLIIILFFTILIFNRKKYEN